MEIYYLHNRNHADCVAETFRYTNLVFHRLLPSCFADFFQSGNIRKYFSAFIAGMVPVLLWFLWKMNTSGLFNRQAAYKSTLPFFNDHTALGASISFCIPVIVNFLLTGIRSLLIMIFILFAFSFLISFSRAAWLSIIAAVIAVTVLACRVRFRTIVLISFAVFLQ